MTLGVPRVAGTTLYPPQDKRGGSFATKTLPLPASAGWVHEEYHRTILGRRGFGSFNDVYKFRVAADAIAVSHVTDDSLVRLKRERPAEQVRLNSAGLEGEYQLVQGLEKREFFDGARSFHMPLYWLEKIGSIAYVTSGTSADTNSETDEMNASDGANIEVRDFTGHDFTAWVYDLHRPSEAYEARGVHPSGVGIDRYIKPSDLTTGELDYLRHQGQLQLINFIDPFLLGYRGVTIGAGAEPLRIASIKVQHTRKGRFGAFAELEAKSAGWVAGSEALDRNVSFRTGLSMILY